MKTLFLTLAVLLIVLAGAPLLNCQASQTCATFNTSTVASISFLLANTAEHDPTKPPSLHAWGITPVASCKYTHIGPTHVNCKTECTVTSQGAAPFNPLGGVTNVERGPLLVVGTHQISGSFFPGDSFGGDGAGKTSCQGTIGAAAANCFPVPGTSKCFVSVSVSAGGMTASTNGSMIFSSGAQPIGANECQEIPDPENAPPPVDPFGHPCSPPPSDEQGFISTEDQDCEPIIIDVEGHGFQLTNTANGVVFDIRADHRPLRIPWTANGNNAFLVLDRNGNGVIDDGTELFSNVSPQPKSAHPNGFRSLAEYDKPENGGDGDGEIDSQDAIFSQLRLWVDANHDGLSQPEELHKLHELGVYSISLNVGPSRRVDEFGNEFLYKARVNQGHHHGDSEVGRIAYDVFFVTK